MNNNHLQELRSRITNRLIEVIFIVAFALTFLDVYRKIFVEHIPIYWPYVIGFVSIALLFTARKELNYTLKITLTAALIAALGLSGLLEYSFAGPRDIVLFSLVYIVLFAPKKIYIPFIAIVSAAYFGIGYLFVNQQLTPAYEVNEASNSKEMWISMTLGVGAITYIITTSFQKYLSEINSLYQSNELVNNELIQKTETLEKLNQELIEKDEIIQQFSKFFTQGLFFQAKIAPNRAISMTYISDSVQHFYGLTPAEVKEDPKRLANAIHPNDYPILLKHIADAPKNKGDIKCRIRVTNAKGELIWMQVVAKLHKKNNHLFIEGVNVTINDIVQFEEHLKAAKNKAEHNNKLKTAFLRNLSHEIRTPLNGILGVTDLLQETTQPEEISKLRQHLQASSERLAHSMNQIIEIATIESKALTIAKTHFSITKTLESILAKHQTACTNKNIEFVYQPVQTLENVLIYSDKNKVEIILENLLTNAILFTKKGSITVTVNHSDSVTSIQITDTGTGIPTDKQELIFEPFGQANLKENIGTEGTGVGLSIAKAYTEALGGNIKMQSVLHKGSCFTVELPIQ